VPPVSNFNTRVRPFRGWVNFSWPPWVNCTLALTHPCTRPFLLPHSASRSASFSWNSLHTTPSRDDVLGRRRYAEWNTACHFPLTYSGKCGKGDARQSDGVLYAGKRCVCATFTIRLRRDRDCVGNTNTVHRGKHADDRECCCRTSGQIFAPYGLRSTKGQERLSDIWNHSEG